jgi:bacterioferritin-associated ferredoxin
MYGDTVDGSWYFKLLREGSSVAGIRDKLMFGESNLGDTGHLGQNRAAAMADTAEVCGCNGVCKGTIVKAIKAKGLFTLEEVRKHTKASSSCGSCTGLVEQILMFTAGGDYSASPKKKAMCGCTDRTHAEVREAIRKQELLSIPPCTSSSSGARRTAARAAARGQLLPPLDLAAQGEGRSAVALHQRALARQHPEGRHLFGDPAHVGRRDDIARSCAASPTWSTSTPSRR